MWKIFFFIVAAFVLSLALWLGFLFWENIKGLGPAILPPPADIGEIIDETPPEEQNTVDFPLSLPEEFSISVFVKDLPGARDMIIDGLGNMWVSQTSEGKISMIEVQNGKMISQSVIFDDLQRPHGLAIHPQDGLLLYIAEENGVSRVGLYSNSPMEKLFDLPRGGNHFTRSILFGPDDRLYTSVGSTCNVCVESDWRRAAVLVSDDEGNNLESFASGLRNAVFMAVHYVTGDIWATEMGRDLLGDDIPPDEINILQEGGNYGWPVCYGKNVHDTKYDQNTYIRAPCQKEFGEIPSYIDLQAHSSPLGLAFVPEEGWPKEYWNDLLVAYHGSWNRTEPTGYKIVRFEFDEQGNYLDRRDFITGWLQNGRALGRPVDILVQPGGVMYISDDKAGIIYKVMYDE